MPRIFISCVTGEFGAYRVEIARYLRRADCDVKIQEEFPQEAVDTIQKLDGVIRSCDAVIHILGEGNGATANPEAVSAFLEDEPRFLEAMKAHGNFRSLRLSYTQWEAYLAAYHGRALFVYRASLPVRDGHPTRASGSDRDWPVFEPGQDDAEPMRQHCARLVGLPTHRYSSPFRDQKDLIGQFIGDLRRIVGTKAQAAIQLEERFGTHKVDELKDLLMTKAERLLKDGFILAGFVQLAGTTPETLGAERSLDFTLIDTLARWHSPHALLGLVKACQTRSEALGLAELSSSLSSWFSAALVAFNNSQRVQKASSLNATAEGLTEKAVSGRCAEAFHYLKPDSYPKPTLEIAWRLAPADPLKRVFAECYVRWGRCHEMVSMDSTSPIRAEAAPTCLVKLVATSRQYGNVPFERMEVFVSEGEINRPWEYVVGSKPEDDDPRLHPWPTVLRLLNRELALAPVKPPPDPVSRQNLACRLGQCDTFIADVRERGGFFAMATGAQDDTKIIQRAAARASLGLWLRNVKPIEAAEACLNELEGLALASVPRQIVLKKLDSPKGSPWRDLAVLYDHPNWPRFNFSFEQFELPDHDRMLQALT